MCFFLRWSRRRDHFEPINIFCFASDMLSFLADDPPYMKLDLGAVEVKEEPLYETPTSSFTEGIVQLCTDESCSTASVSRLSPLASLLSTFFFSPASPSLPLILDGFRCVDGDPDAVFLFLAFMPSDLPYLNQFFCSFFCQFNPRPAVTPDFPPTAGCV